MHRRLQPHASQTFVVPVVGGRCVRGAVVSGRVGGATLTQLMLDVLAARTELDLSRLREGALPAITVARNLKARLYLLWLHVPWLHLPWLHSLWLFFFYAYSYHAYTCHAYTYSLWRPLQERYGAVHPTPLQQRLGHSPLDMAEMRRRADPAANVHVELEGGYAFTLGWERYPNPNPSPNPVPSSNPSLDLGPNPDPNPNPNIP